MSRATDIIDLLAARRGIVCAVGAGGKKSVLRAIAAAHAGRVALTGTVPFAPPPTGALDGLRFTGDLDTLAQHLEATAGPGIIVFGLPEEKKGRWGGLPPAVIAEWHARFAFDVTLVKADGARMRWVKAPAESEPVVTPNFDTLIPVLSARALGEPLSERIAHRVPQVSQVTGCREGAVFQPIHAARLLTSDEGLLKSAGPEQVRPVINMVDDAPRQALALEAAQLALEMTDRFEQILLLRLKNTTEIAAVVHRKESGR